MNNTTLQIGKKRINEQSNPYFIADIAANHDGDLQRAYKLIELAKEAGADCAKFQNFTADKIVSKKGFENVGQQLSHQATWKKSVFEIYKDASIPVDWTPLLKEKCDEVDIEYMTSPYDYESVNAVDAYLNAYKIGSGDITWIEMLQFIASKNKPVLLATGASNLEDVIRAINAITAINKQLVLMQCNTNYTASSENFKHINLNVLSQYKALYPNLIIGLSDHSFGHTTVLGAIALGARVIEKHFTDDNDRIGPDHRFSMNPGTWSSMVKNSEELFESMGDGIKRIEDNELQTAVVQRRAYYYSKSLMEGQIITKEDIFPLRPAVTGGIPPYDAHLVVGKRLSKSVIKDQLVTMEDICHD